MSIRLARPPTKSPPDVTDGERLLCVLARRSELWKKMPLGNPGLNLTINKQCVEKASPVKEGDEITRVGFFGGLTGRNGHSPP